MTTLTDMTGRTCIVTGASNGIGRVTASALAEMGARVVMVCRDAGRGEAARAEIAQRSGSDGIDLLVADLGSQAQVRRLAYGIRSRYDRLDVLVNNAGAYNSDRALTEDGIETTWAVNHLAYFLLTNLLLDMVRETDNARVVNVASRAHTSARIDFDDLQGERKWGGYRAYAQSKLANILFTYELARRLDATSVTTNCLHPGVVYTGFAMNNATLSGAVIRTFYSVARPFLLSAEKGAETSIYLAASPEVEGVSGKYFANRKETRSSARSYDAATAQRLWQISEEMTQPRAAAAQGIAR